MVRPFTNVLLSCRNFATGLAPGSGRMFGPTSQLVRYSFTIFETSGLFAAKGWVLDNQFDLLLWSLLLFSFLSLQQAPGPCPDLLCHGFVLSVECGC